MLRSSYYHNNRFCEVCGAHIRFDLILPKELREKIFINGFEYMCPSCIMRRLENISENCKFELVEVWRPNLKWSPEDSQEEDVLHKCDIKHKEIYFHGNSCPACQLLGGYNDLRAMYFEEYHKNESKGR